MNQAAPQDQMNPAVTPRLLAALAQQCGQAAANVLELQICNADLAEALQQQIQHNADQAQRIQNDAEIIKAVRADRDEARARAETAERLLADIVTIESVLPPTTKLEFKTSPRKKAPRK